MTVSGQISGTAYYTNGSGPAIIFVHGNASTHATWAEVIAHLSAEFRCISYDLRGHGSSAPINGELTLDGLVEDLRDLQDGLGIKQVFIVGHSLGAFVAAEYARRHPQRTRALCLLAMPFGRGREERKKAEVLVGELAERGVAATMEKFVKLWYTDAFVTLHPGVLDKRLRQIAGIDETAFLASYRLYARIDMDHTLEQITVPTLVATGESANGCGAEVARQLHSEIGGSELVVFREMKNGILTEIPDRVAETLKTFLAAHMKVQACLDT